MTSKQQKYVEIIEAAAKTHAAVAPLARRIADCIRLVLAMGVRQPDDWQFHFSGYVEFRWYDGGKTFSGSTKHVGLDAGSGKYTIRGRLTKDKYGSGGGIQIEGLTPNDAATILKILVGIVDDAKALNDPE
jgi:hypothetical protein